MADQIDMMCAFIRQEAKEKVNEIELKTQNDAILEAGMIIHNAKTRVRKEVQEEEKRIKTQQGVKVIRTEAAVRVEKMKVRESLLDDVRIKAIKALQQATSDNEKNIKLLTDLIVQGLLQIREPKVDLVVRDCDVAAAKAAAPRALSRYLEISKLKTGKEPKCAVNVNPIGQRLPPPDDGSGKASCAGGVKLIGDNGKIVCDNTLDTRLKMAFEDLMPEIRQTLFSQRV